MDRNNKKVLIIGLDSLTWDVLDPLFDRGRMPKLKSLREGGCSGILRSTAPPMTPAAWTTLMTGVNPGKHRVDGWEIYDRDTNRLSFTNSQTIAVETMWSYLSRLGYRVASLNLPQTYPPFPVNGVMVAGYGCPGVDSNYTWPGDFKDKIKEHIPDYDVVIGWQKGDAEDDAVFADAMACCKRSFNNSYKLAQLAQREYGWDVMLIQIQQTDRLLHKLWRYIDPANWERWPRRAEQLFDLFDHLDEVVGRLAAMADGRDDLVIVASDHGHGPNGGFVKPNNLLRDWGYLCTQRPIRHLAKRLKRNVLRSLGHKMSHGRGQKSLADKLKLDWSGTRAVAAYSCQHSNIFLNLKGRHKSGIVEPGREYQTVLNELRERFSRVTDPRNGKKIFTAIATPQEIYGIAKDDDSFGDLILIGHEDYLLVRSIRGESFIEHADDGNLGGDHRMNGIYLLSGSKVKLGMRLDGDIADIAPTIYAFLGVSIPDSLDGEVLEEAFDLPFKYHGEKIPKTHPEKPSYIGKERLRSASIREQQEIYKRLADLGYLD